MGKDGRVRYGRERMEGYGTDGKGWKVKVRTGKNERVAYGRTGRVC